MIATALGPSIFAKDVDYEASGASESGLDAEHRMEFVTVVVLGHFLK